MKHLIISLLLTAIIGLVNAQDPQIYWRFNNVQYINNNSQLQFDVEIHTDQDGIYMKDMQVYFDYNPLQFGANIRGNGNIYYQPIGIMVDPGVPGNPFAPLYGIVNDADNTSTRYAIITETLYPNCTGWHPIWPTYPCKIEVPTTWVGLLRFTINVQNCAVPAGINFVESIMDGGQYYTLLGSTAPMPFAIPGIYENDLNNITCNSFLDLELTAFLEGPFEEDNGQMENDLNTAAYLPNNQPYNVGPWNYTGAENVAGFDEEIIDWVLVELRETPTDDPATANGSTAIARRAGFILRDGSIVDLDGSSTLHFNVQYSDYLFVVLYHRNHLAVMSNYSLQTSSSTCAYDFSTDVNQVYGGINAHKEIGSGVWGMAAGDGNADGNVDNTDKNDVWTPSAGLLGYLPGDYNMDAFVENADKNVFWYPNSGGGSGVPEGSVPDSGYQSYVHQ